jgi:outer membrane protein assembly factor BamA
MHLGVRTDMLYFKAQDTLSLSYEITDKQQYWGMSRVEYVFDNTIRPSLNIYNGVRYKVYGEYMYRMNGKTGGFYSIGTDIRVYKKLYKNFIWATRFAGATSGGDMKILYHIGGVDNWISPKYSNYVPVRPYENYAFEALATNLRGYEQNSRNGNTYAVINTEFRLPVFTTFIKRPIQSSLIKHMQLVAFADLGSAWRGLWPNTETLRNNRFLPDPNDPTADPQVQLEIVDESGGVGFGYGAGLRTMILGYFVRVDAGWNIENHQKSPLIHVSIGTDF